MSVAASTSMTPSGAGAGLRAAPSHHAVTSSISSNTTGNVSYELFAPRSTAQVARLSRIAALTAGPTAAFGSAETTGQDNKKDGRYSNRNEPADDTLLQAMSPPMTLPSLEFSTAVSATSQQQDDGVQSVSTTLNEAMLASDHLTHLLKHTTSLRLALRASINIAEDISNRHADLIRHSGELSAAADRLQEEQEMLKHHAEEIGRPLKHYDAVDHMGIAVGVLFKGRAVVRGLAKVKVDHDEFPSILDQIDDAVDFFGRESGGQAALEEEARRQKQRRGSSQQPFETSGNVEYYRRSLALQEAALYLIKEAVVDRIATTTKQISDALGLPKTAVAADRLEASLIYTRFHGISSRSNKLLSLVRHRLHRGTPYHELLQLCRTTYCNSRESLLKTTVRNHMDELKDQHGLVGMTRLASVFLIRLCTVETSLYLDFFGEKKSTAEDGSEQKTKDDAKAKSDKIPAMASQEVVYDSDFQAYLTSLTSALHRTLRRGLVTLLDLDTLCQIVSVLREERAMASSSPTTTAAARAISSVIEDSQERLIFCATNSLTKEVIRFKPTPKDLDYPKKLEVTKTESNADTEGGEEKVDSTEDVIQKQMQVYESWFPPMRSVLKILSKIFRVVEPRVFEDIALQSVQSCATSLKNGAAYIQKKSGTIHSDLFLVKHLLILREQLSPFDIELRSVERQLDFSDAGKAVSRFLANRNRRLFSMSTENALVTLLREGVGMKEESVDSKRDLEEALRTACNDFIDHTCTSLAGSVMELSSKLMSGYTSDTLKTSPFFHATTIKDMLTSTSNDFESKAGNVTTQMSLYLDNPATQVILLKPISKKISKALEEIRKAACAVLTDGGDGDEVDENRNSNINGWDESIRSEVLLLIDEIEKELKKAARASSK